MIEKTDSGWHRRDYYLHNLNVQMEGLWLRFCSDGSMADSTVYEDGQMTGNRRSRYRDGYPRDGSVIRPDGSGVEAGWFGNALPKGGDRDLAARYF